MSSALVGFTSGVGSVVIVGFALVNLNVLKYLQNYTRSTRICYY